MALLTIHPEVTALTAEAQRLAYCAVDFRSIHQQEECRAHALVLRWTWEKGRLCPGAEGTALLATLPPPGLIQSLTHLDQWEEAKKVPCMFGQPSQEAAETKPPTSLFCTLWIITYRYKMGTKPLAQPPSHGTPHRLDKLPDGVTTVPRGINASI